jgi:osmoprotectant transport system substrate-binding protein
MVAGLLALVLVGAACGSSSSSSGTTTAGGGATTTAGGTGAAATFDFVPLDAGGPNTKSALTKGDIDIALLFSSDGAIAKNNWVALEDDKHLQPVDNFVPAISKDKATPEVSAVLNDVSSKLEVKDMQSMVASVSIDGQNPEDVAKKFLSDNDLPGDKKASGSITIGSANFAESEIAAELYANALSDAGMQVTKKLQFGARETYIPALESGQLDLVPEFVGTLWSFLDKNATPTSDLDETLNNARTAAEAKGFTLLDASPADSVNTFVVTKQTADKYKLSKVSDLVKVKDKLTLGGPPECPTRPYCLLGLEQTYGLKFNA